MLRWVFGVWFTIILFPALICKPLKAIFINKTGSVSAVAFTHKTLKGNQQKQQRENPPDINDVNKFFGIVNNRADIFAGIQRLGQLIKVSRKKQFPVVLLSKTE